jgi:hypothetical protein
MTGFPPAAQAAKVAPVAGGMAPAYSVTARDFAVSGNHPSLWSFFNKVKRLWLASLKRRSQTARLSWERFVRLVARFFPPIRTLHPLPCHRFDAKTRPSTLTSRNSGIQLNGSYRAFFA